MSDALTLEDRVAIATYSGPVRLCPPCTFTEAPPAKRWFNRRRGKGGGRKPDPVRDAKVREMALAGASCVAIGRAIGSTDGVAHGIITRLGLHAAWKAARAVA